MELGIDEGLGYIFEQCILRQFHPRVIYDSFGTGKLEDLMKLYRISPVTQDFFERDQHRELHGLLHSALKNEVFVNCRSVDFLNKCRNIPRLERALAFENWCSGTRRESLLLIPEGVNFEFHFTVKPKLKITAHNLFISGETKMAIIDRATNNYVREHEVEGEPITSLAVSENVVAIGTMMGNLQLYNIQAGSTVSVSAHNSTLGALAVRGPLLVTGAKTLKTWYTGDTEAQREVSLVSNGNISCLALNENNRSVCVGTDTATPSVYDIERGTVMSSLTDRVLLEPKELSFLDHDVILVGCSKEIALWDLRTQKSVVPWTLPRNHCFTSFSSDNTLGFLAAINGPHSNISLYDARKADAVKFYDVTCCRKEIHSMDADCTNLYCATSDSMFTLDFSN